LPTARVRDLQIYAHLQPEFSFLKTNLMAVPRIVAIFRLALACKLDDPISNAAGIKLGGGEQSIRAPATEESNDEDEVFSGSAAACAVTRCASCGSGANAR
jgi:hypothetical protein